MRPQPRNSRAAPFLSLPHPAPPPSQGFELKRQRSRSSSVREGKNEEQSDGLIFTLMMCHLLMVPELHLHCARESALLRSLEVRWNLIFSVKKRWSSILRSRFGSSPPYRVNKLLILFLELVCQRFSRSLLDGMG
jgi:hypothetical protein